jgi:hypothetical protein
MAWFIVHQHYLAKKGASTQQSEGINVRRLISKTKSRNRAERRLRETTVELNCRGFGDVGAASGPIYDFPCVLFVNSRSRAKRHMR